MTSQKVRTFVLETEEQLAQKLGLELVRCEKQALTKGRSFRIGLSGGSLVQLLTKAITSTPQLDTARWVFFFCDERYVPNDHSDSTFFAYKTHLLTQIPTILEKQFIKADTTKPLDECAADYESRLRAEFSDNTLPQFDLLLLGIGPDGHTCSLFPDQPVALAEVKRLVIPIRNSPKPPPERITFTFPLINNATDTIFALMGAGKADIVKRAFVESDEQLPAALVRPTKGQLTLIMDNGAGHIFLPAK
ncbi:probable 6-phosphogluconolactonase [Scaptodrosophila lebanonensis]|uniref:6-phosphogluconolactonase n=1 Tax=Drosophila lebanonensis TaxID=7225 RepID=A0A6J2TRP6_DROLE|nr:probable 6-phosphogluconolactonase [Scaptodrosophila lebanonensis]